MVLIGYILDIQDGHKEKEIILLELLAKYLNDEEEFYEFLNLLNGRYILIFSNDEETRLYTDATSMKPAFYYEDWLFSSHEIIIKEIIKSEENVDLVTREYSMRSFLDYTNTEGIYRFNPNLFFHSKILNFKGTSQEKIIKREI